MHKKLPVSIAVAVLLALASSCQQQKNSSDKPEMFETSELAQLMRDMASHKEEIKKALIEESFDADMVVRHFEKLDSAKATKPNTKNEVFQGLSAAYKQSMIDFIAAPDSSRISAYNNSVQACVNCHQQFCQLPIERIEKLYID
jgi:hypothetical protein